VDKAGFFNIILWRQSIGHKKDEEQKSYTPIMLYFLNHKKIMK